MSKYPVNIKLNFQFGILLSGLLFASSIYSFLSLDNILLSLSLFLSGSIFLTITIINPALLKKPACLWNELGLIIGNISRPIILTGIYFLLITPLAFVLRLFGRDELSLKKIQVKSYWINRTQDSKNITSFKNQY